MKGKEKCKALKEIRQKIAEQNDIAFAVSECTHQGDCRGTCPKCEAELRYLERQLEIRKNLGKAVVVAGISAGMCAPMVACNPIDAIGNVIEDVYYTINPSAAPIAGDVEYIPEDVQGMEGPAPVELSGDVEYIPEDIDGGLEDEELELTGEETWNPDLEEPSEEDLEENTEIDEYTLEGDVVIDPEYLDEE